MDPLAFRCTSCGNCCRNLRVAVTAADVSRLSAATGQPPIALVEWLAPEAVDMTGEPSSFVELSQGRRLMVLAQRAGACVLLAGDDRCRAYDARPLDCRAFPFDFEDASTAKGRRRLRLLPHADCDHAQDGDQDALALAALDERRWQALLDYQARVRSWNRLAKQRRRLGHRVGSVEAFLSFAFDSL
jgi:Fe-S-cluster containining protein